MIQPPEGESEPKRNDIHELAKEAYATDLIILLIKCLEYLEFEARKDVVFIVNNLIKLMIGGRYTTVDYIVKNPQILKMLLSGYEKCVKS